MTKDFDAVIEGVTSHLTSERQAWLFGAGISCRSGLPLMYPLTELVAAATREQAGDRDLAGAI